MILWIVKIISYTIFVILAVYFTNLSESWQLYVFSSFPNGSVATIVFSGCLIRPLPIPVKPNGSHGN